MIDSIPGGNRSPSLTGKIVLVTGASSGIGRAIALACAHAGGDVIVTYRSNQAGAEGTAREIAALGRQAGVIRADVGDDASVATLVDAVRRDAGRVDAWINNAGADILTGAGAALSPLERLDLLMQVDLRGTILASWAAVELMRGQPGGGCIVNMSWDHVLHGMEGTNPQIFAAVKGGVLAFSKSLARTVAPDIRVNILGPGWIQTAFGDGLEEERYHRVAHGTPLRRWGTPEDVAEAAVFLASDASSFLTGQLLMVNGGIVM